MSDQQQLVAAPAVTALPARQIDDGSSTLALLREAIFLNPQVYAVVRDSRSSLGRGFAALLWTLIIVVVARGLSLGFGLLTTPRLDILQSQFYTALTGTRLYIRLAERTPEFAQQFWQGYTAIWEAVRLIGGFPSTTGALSAIVAVLLYTLVGWLFFGLLAHLAARWFGGRASLGQFLGALAFAYAPMILSVVVLIPGARVAAPAIFLLLLVARYQAIKTVHDLTPGYSLAALVTPFVVGFLIDISIIAFAAAYGISQIPYLEEALRAWRIIQWF